MVLWLVCGLLSPMLLTAQQAPNYIFYNGKILTVDSNFTIAQAVAVSGNQIAAVGTDTAVLPLAGQNTIKVDLKGRTMIPGLIDTHRHMYSYAEGAYGRLLTPEQRRRYPMNWNGVRTKEDIVNQVRGGIELYKPAPGKWMYFTGGPAAGAQTEIHFDQLTAADLNKGAPNNPVVLGLGIPDFNGFMVNKVALDMLLDKHGAFIRKYGRFWVDSSGQPDGHLEPPASRLVSPYTYDRKPEDLAVLYKPDMEEMNSMGITTVISRLPEDTKNAYTWLRDRNQMTVRVGQGMIEPFGNIEDLATGMAALRGKTGSGDDWQWITGVGPTAIDGSGSRACTDQKRTGGAYGALDAWFPVGQCHNDIEYRGSPKRAGPISGNYYREWTVESARNGVRFANVHAAGDRAVGGFLNIVEQVQREMGPDATRGWATDHCTMVNPADFDRLARLKVMMSCLIRINLSGMARSYGEEIANTFHAPAKSMIDAGVKVVFETDTNVYIWDHMETFVTRKDNNGKVWGPQDRVDHPTILKMTTSWAAEYALKPDKLGTIEKGKLADLVVLDKDFLAISSDDISELKPQITLVDGRIVYVHTDFARENNFRPAGSLVSTYEDLRARRPGGSDGFGGGG
jgi:predicted amidohydrolase YtcJ